MLENIVLLLMMIPATTLGMLLILMMLYRIARAFGYRGWSL